MKLMQRDRFFKYNPVYIKVGPTQRVLLKNTVCNRVKLKDSLAYNLLYQETLVPLIFRDYKESLRGLLYES